ncbi:MAG: DUF2961 domain-containing protein, partial [Verrucomicrobia bacterium]|nr:DUF2961 domain-containing protein [Verrucomicrobiota bacterium]
MNARHTTTVLLSLFLVSSILSGAGCSKPEPVHYDRSWSDVLGELIDIERMAHLDIPGTRLISSVDPSGGNNDYNNYLGKGPDGWWVLADLKGPGSITRYWTTGLDHDHKIRFYFDNEKKPRIETTVRDFFENPPLFVPFLSDYEQGCRYSYVPVPYTKRLLITAEPAGYKPDGWPRLFYQLNVSDFAPGEVSSPLPSEPTASDLAKVAEVRRAWSGDYDALLPELETVTASVRVEPGQTADIPSLAGPAIIRRLSISPRAEGAGTVSATDAALRDVMLRIRWDGSESASVDVPLAPFFGSFYRRTRFDSMFLGMKGEAFHTRFPMPFKSGADISFENTGGHPVLIDLEIGLDKGRQDLGALGYFHASWQRSGPEDVGHPHTVVRSQGKGKFVGCMLSVRSADRSWWMLEGDESIRINGDANPVWHGTGLEDYFNGGWYYRNVMARPLNGLLYLQPFATIQYRFHLVDPVFFDAGVSMQFERGPDHASRGWMESVGYYYLDEPAQAISARLPREKRQPPPDDLEEVTFMPQVLDFERLGDFQGASDRISEYLEKHPDDPASEVLRLRQIACRELMDGIDAVRGDYEAFIASAKDQRVARQAQMLLWLHENPENGLLGAYCNARTSIFIDGEKVGEVDHPEQLGVLPVKLAPGKHVIVLEATRMRDRPWAQILLRTSSSLVASGPDWRWTKQPAPGFHEVCYDDSSWNPVWE